MMTNKTSKSSHLLKLLALLPIVGVTLALNAETVTDVVYMNDEPQKQVPVKKGKKNATLKTNGNTTIQVVETQDQKNEAEAPKTVQHKEKVEELVVVGYATPNEQTEEPKDVFDVVEVMPQFPGGATALFEFLAKTIKYPAEAEKAGKQGRVIATFVVKKDGSISGTHVVKSVDPLLDAEAVRVLNSMPNWTPGTQNGKTVNVKYTVPISFRLDGNAKETPTATGTFTPKESAKSTPLNELVKQLPGAKIDENGNLTINGKPVKRIMADGKVVTIQELPKVVDAKKATTLETDDLIISTKEK